MTTSEGASAGADGPVEVATVRLRPDGPELPSFEQQASLVYGSDVCADGLWIDRAVVDQWWRITIACEHGEWAGVSNGPIDLGRGLQRALAAASAGHPPAVRDA